MPTLVAVALCAGRSSVSASMTVVLLTIVVLMQSSVNTFNDYFDYVKGLDSPDDNVEPADSVLVYNDVDPKGALRLAFGFIASAFLLGIYPVVVAGLGPLVIALLGAAFVALYSAGKTPISYLPLGELASGIVMGGLVPLAVVLVLSRQLDFAVLALAVPTVIGVGLIMFTNNTCDIERDIPAGRRTLSIVLGRRRAVHVYRVCVFVWLADIIANVAVCFTSGLLLVPFMLLASYPSIKALVGNPLTAQTRLQAMPQILAANVSLGAFYALMILSASSLVVTL